MLVDDGPDTAADSPPTGEDGHDAGGAAQVAHRQLRSAGRAAASARLSTAKTAIMAHPWVAGIVVTLWVLFVLLMVITVLMLGAKVKNGTDTIASNCGGGAGVVVG